MKLKTSKLQVGQDIVNLQRQIAGLSEALTEAVAEAREHGYSWKDITARLAVPKPYGQTPLGNHFPTGISTTAVRSYYIDRTDRQGRRIS